ncbi:MAG: dynamin family protein [Selenomonas sp.]|nr:dynamin family protein [Selenomonas sp.]
MKNMFPEITESLIKFRKILAARDEYEDSLDELDEIIKDSTEPLLVMVMGEFSTGKSTFINALVGEKIAAVNATPTTAVITKLCYGESSKVIVHYKDGSQEESPNIDFENLTAENQTDYIRHDEIFFVERCMPIDILKTMSIIDSPGLNSINQGHTAATKNFVDKADAVIWMFDANKPVSQTEMTAMAKLNPRLQPIAIVNKMDDLNEDEDDEVTFLNGIRQKLKDKVQRVIGISAKWAFMGKVNGNEKQIVASNIGEFYQTLDELVLPNIKTYKMNTLIDDITGYVVSIMDRIEAGEAIVAGLQDEDYASYMEEREKQIILRDGLDEVLMVFGSSVPWVDKI